MFDSKFLFFFIFLLIEVSNYEICLIIPPYVDTARVDKFIQLIKDDLLETTPIQFSISYTVNDTAEGISDFITSHSMKDIVFFGYSFSMDLKSVDKFLAENNLLMLSPDPSVRSDVCSKNMFFPAPNTILSLECIILYLFNNYNSC